MVVPAFGAGAGAEQDGPPGYTYGAVLIRTEDAVAVTAALAEIRFSGWVAPPEDGWTVAVARVARGTVAAGRRGVLGLAEWLASRFPEPVLAFRVLVDRQLVLAAWIEGEELGRYISDPSREPEADKDILSEPLGAEYAEAFAAAAERPDAAEDLGELLAEELDPDSVIESERLSKVLRLLGLPTWLVAAATLPKDIPTGPRGRDLTRLGAGRTGFGGRLAGRAAEVLRKRRRPPPVVTDAPKGQRMDPWLM
jgi:hypothetical protein